MEAEEEAEDAATEARSWNDVKRRTWVRECMQPQSVQVPQSCLTLCVLMDCTHQAPLSITSSQNLLELHIHWIGDAIQPSHPVVPFSHLQSFPASGSFPMSQLFASGGQSIGVSASASVLPINAVAAAKSLQSCRNLCDHIDGSPPGSPLSLGFSRHEHGSGLPFPSLIHESEEWKWTHSVMSNS